MDAIEMMGRIAASWKRRTGGRLLAFGITLPQYNLIRLARQRGSIKPSTAAEELAIDRPTTTVVLRRCVEEGWLGRSRSTADHRSIRLQLTGAGEELLDRIEATRPFAASAFGDPLDVLDGEERAALLRLLDRVQRRAADIWR